MSIELCITPDALREFIECFADPSDIDELSGRLNDGAIQILNPAVTQDHDRVFTRLGRNFQATVKFSENPLALALRDFQRGDSNADERAGKALASANTCHIDSCVFITYEDVTDVVSNVVFGHNTDSVEEVRRSFAELWEE